MRLFALALPLSLIGAGCSRDEVPTWPQASVVLVSIDTLRADRLPLYGYAKGRTPHLDALGREGVLFEDAWSHVPLTLPAHASMLTGLLPPKHGVRDNVGFRLGENSRTLAQRFKEKGVATGGAVSAYVLRSATGMGRGFDSYDDALVVDESLQSLGALQRDGAVAVASVLRFAAGQGGKRFFAFLHLYEPHSPWTPPERFRDLPSPYDGDVALADEHLGRLVQGLRQAGLYDRVILAVTSDHGEGLRDHGEEEHGIFLYREALHVPLLLRLPGGERGGTRVSGLVAQVDLPATLLDLAGLPTDAMDGASLRGAIAAGKSSGRTVYSETLYPRYHFGWSDLYSATEDRYRFIEAPRPELYDRATDPVERTNLAPERTPAVASMTAWLRGVKGGVTAPEAVDAETREKLAALGYVGAGALASAPEGVLADPKDRIGSYEDLKRGLALRREGKDAEAVEQLRRVVATNPLMTDAWESLGICLNRLGRDRESLLAFEKVLEIDPLRADTHLALAKLYAFDGKSDLAVKHAEVAAGKEPGRGFEILAQIMMDARRPQEAATYARRSLAADPGRAVSPFILGAAARAQGRCEEAVASFAKAAAAAAATRGAAVRGLHFQWGDCLARLGREAEAERQLQAELQLYPASPEARVGLAMLYRSQGRDEAARAAITGLVAAERTPSAETYWTVVRTLSVLGDRPAAAAWAAQARQRFPTDRRFR